MKKFLLSIAIALPLSLFAQGFKPGWYILEPGAEIQVAMPSTKEVLSFMHEENNDQNLTLEQLEKVCSDVTFMKGECVFIMDTIEGSYIATDPAFRALYIRGKVTPTIQKPFSTVGYVEQDIASLSGVLIKAGAFVWIVEETQSGKYTIQLHNGIKSDVDPSKVSVVKQFYSVGEAPAPFKQVK